MIVNWKLMICWISGFESAVLKLPPQKPGKVYPIAPVAFVTFQRKCDAQIAIDKLQGEKFDDEYATTLRLEFAKSNTKNKMKSLKVKIWPQLTPDLMLNLILLGAWHKCHTYPNNGQ